MMNDLVSVVIPVKNGEKYIKEAIEGILSQNMNVEIIVVDDCSTDNTVKIAMECGCKIVKHETSKGQVAGKNSGLKVAQGKYVIFHDHDDVVRAGVWQKMYAEISANNEIYAIEAKVQDFYSPDLSKEEQNRTIIKKEPYWGLFTGAILMRKEIFDVIGYFNEGVYSGEIIEWQSKMDANNLKIKKLDIVSTNRRVHSSNFGKTARGTEFKDYAAILRAKLAAAKR